MVCTLYLNKADILNTFGIKSEIFYLWHREMFTNLVKQTTFAKNKKMTSY